MDKRERIRRFADERPMAKAVYGYGSGVFRQSSCSGVPQTDIIFVVDDIRKWHRDNMNCNGDDYSFMGRIHLSTDNVKKLKGKNFITYFSDIRYEGTRFKYGVVEFSDFRRGLSTWDNLFLVGRFHKPILDVLSDDVLKDVINKNRDGAFRIACLLSNPVTDKESIFRVLCGLSYMGDARMGIAENPDKVKNIVRGAFENFERIYRFKEPFVKVLSNGTVLIDHDYLLSEIDKLPPCLVDYLAEYDTDLCNLEIVRTNILKYIVGHNKEESKAQIVEGIKTNGIIKSIPYALSKIRKKIGS